MVSKKNKCVFSVSFFVLLFVIFVVYYTFLFGKYEKTNFHDSFELDTHMVWRLEDETGVKEEFSEYPYCLQAKANVPFTLRATLPDNIESGYGFAIQTNYSCVRIFVEDTQIHSYATTQPLPIGHLVGNIRLITELAPEMSGKELTVQYTPFYSTTFPINTIYFGKVDALKLQIVYANIWRIVIATILFTVAFCCHGFFVFHEIKKHKVWNRAFFHLGFFLMNVASWLICNSDIPQLYVDYNETISLISFIALTFFATEFAGYVEALFPSPKRALRFLQYAGLALTIIELFGFVTTLWDPPQILILNHLHIAVVILYTLYFAIRQRKNGTVEHIFLLSVIVLLITALTALIFFYMNGANGMDGIILGCGILVFAFLLFIILLFKEVGYIQERKSLVVYRELAYKDPLTGLSNRGAFDKAFADLQSNATHDTLFQLAILDLNRLKKMNDTVGHFAGDKMIIGAAECIESAFSKNGSCYRLGGDEFAVLYTDKPITLHQDFENFHLILADYNRHNSDIPVSIAEGIAEAFWDESEHFFRDLFHKADQQMYIDKQQKHKLLDELEQQS